ncbi:MAG: sugar-binding domain-containing protein [Verrucomicrobiota bacterium]
MKPKSHLLLLTVLAVASIIRAADGEGITSLSTNSWKVAPEGEVKETGEQISAPGFNSDKWLTAHVPGTAFVDYVIAGEEQDPNFGENVWKLGGKLERKKYDQNFWYRTGFEVPAEYFDGGKIWLNLDGVHRDGDVFVNGTKVGTMLGFFQRGRFDVTKLVKKAGPNALAVLAHIMEVPQDKGPDGRWNFNVSSPSLLCSRGWDWMPRVPGLNTGIYKDVYLSHTGDVSILDPWIRTDRLTATDADLSIQTELTNSSDKAVTGNLVGEINPGKIAFSKTVTLKPGETQTVTLKAADTPALRISNPKLWWPNGYGEPNLYTCKLEFRVADKVSDQRTGTFGIKKYTYEVKNDILHFSINGTPLFLKGGSWGLPEYLMRNRTAADYDTRVRLHKEQNFNVIRNWMGSVPDEAFYEACDKYGIMVWDELWLNAHDGDPRDIPVYHANVVEKVKQMRNHPSVCFWVAMNEGTPPPPVNDPLAEIIAKYDGNDREYHPCSNSGNLSGSGPWTNFDPPVYFRGTFVFNGVEKPPGKKEPYGMRSELGTAAFTSFDSFKKFMPNETWWPRNQTWDRHYFGPKARNAFPDNYQYKLGMHYGEPADIEDYCRKAQLFNLETMKGMFEGWLDHTDQNAAGLIIWMSHPAYPCFVWQTYDYYYDTTGAYWGAKTACEPVHIFWNSDANQIRVSNTSGKPVENLKADFWIFNMDGTQKAHQETKLNIKPFEVVTCFNFPQVEGLSPTHFLRLRLTDPAGKIVSENFYWKGQNLLNYFGLSDMKPVTLSVSKPVPEALPDGLTRLSVDVTNPANSGTVAFAIRPKPVRSATGEQVLPVYMNDGYFSLMPGETKHVIIEYNPANAGGESPKVEVECWNNFPHPKPKEPPPPPTKEERAASNTQ